ncbi:MAG: homoserine kinase [Pontixanthobacter sp.]
MAVYTHLTADDFTALIAHYDVGTLISAKGIAEGVSNSNWLIETTQGRYILTMYERRLDIADLPFFLNLLDHLAAHGCPVPATIHDRQGAAYRMVDGKAVALIEFLPGVSIERPNPRQAYAVGRALAELHLEAAGFAMVRENDLRPADWKVMLNACDDARIDGIDTHLRPAIDGTLPQLIAEWPTDLPLSTIHADLFPDNVLMIGDNVGGLIDFYFACTDFAAYDLAVTHAAWCFDDEGHVFDRATSDGLIAGYCSRRALSTSEWRALPLFAQGAAMRFVATRTFDWIDTPDDALVTRKDPMAFVRRMEFYKRAGGSVFKPVEIPLSDQP